MDEAGVFIQVGKRVLIDPDAFYRWAAKNGGQPISPRADTQLGEEGDGE